MHCIQTRWVRGILFLSIGIFAAGCGGGSDRPETATVSGRLSVNGAALPGYIVTFHPASGRPSVSNAPTDAEGKFELWYTFRDKGAKVDKHKVTLAYSPSDDKGAMEALSGDVKGVARNIAERYGTVEVTPLEFDVTNDTTEANFDITVH